MRTLFSKIAFLAAFGLALALTFSCSSGGDGGGDSGGSSSSGSGSAAYTLTCAAVPSTGIVGATITPPIVTCNGISVRNGLNWTKAPNWNNPVIGTYNGISVSASSGNCKGKSATCSGTLTVSSAPEADQLTCTGMPTTGVAGTAITPPTVRCGTKTVTTSITWTNAPNWNNPAASTFSTYNVSATASCGGSSKTASCGTLTIASVLSCNKVATSGTAGIAITPPTVTCTNTTISKTISNDLDWFNAPDWSNPEAGTYRGISVYANYGECSGETATCSGTLTVTRTSSNSVVSSSSSSSAQSSSSNVSSSSIGSSSSSSSKQSSSSNVSSSSSVVSSSSSSVQSSSSAPKCNGQNYTPPNQRCENDVIETKCGTNWYNATNTDLKCESSIVKTRCGTGNNFHNPATQFCNGNEVLSKCGGDTYIPSTQFCSGSSIYEKCNGKDYTPTSQRCENDVVETKCGSNWYNATNTNLRCQSNVVETKCGSNWYNALTESCSNGTVFITDSRDGQTYKTVTIGTQVWMAKNLNYNATNSLCYGDNTGGDSQGNCAKYGRLYAWATAMGIDEKYNGEKWGGSDVKHQGICPSGWHLPSNAEWTQLTNFVGGLSTAGTKLKATSGWTSSGTDDYGFAALPGGYGLSYGSFDHVGSVGYWWTATEFLSEAYRRAIFESVADYSNFKSNLYSVRCIKD